MDAHMKRRMILTLAIAATIREIHEGPEGPAYAACLVQFPELTAAEFGVIVRSLEVTGAIRRFGHTLRWASNPEWTKICDEADRIAKIQ